MKELDVLELAEWGEQMFGGGIVTGGRLRRRDVLRYIEHGLVRSIGHVPLCDDDGGIIEPERYREAFALTEAGKTRLGQLRREGNG